MAENAPEYSYFSNIKPALWQRTLRKHPKKKHPMVVLQAHCAAGRVTRGASFFSVGRASGGRFDQV
ncbi:hypothetical protein [uncultured Maritimibacter sp.]|jgi:hypothetical protein|uniref:hypothetical protein n=1 Tax=uncultured Maritimibacter sp. TaxID=991866 RepID=UPI002605C86F|nr:hypothetical protein [uncultured Maritimibacter sp.]